MPSVPVVATGGQVELEPVTVRAARTETALADVPAAVTVIDGDELRRGGRLTSLAEVLVGVPGLFVQNATNFAQDARIALRGFGARSAFGIRGVAIVVDGIPHTLPDGQAQVDSIDLAEIERIEILRGPASALYGNAAGGVIRITTRSAAGAATAGVRQSAGEFGLLDTHASLAAGGSRAGVRLSLGRLESDGFRRHARAEQYRANARFDLEPGPATRIRAHAGYFETPIERDPGALTAEQARAAPRMANPANVRFDAGELLEQWRFGAGLDHRFADIGRLHVAAFGYLRDFENRLPFADGGQVTFERAFSGLDLRQELGTGRLGLAGQATFGIDYRRQDDDRRRFDNLDGIRGPRVLDQQEQVTALGVYFQQRARLGPDWTLAVGVRYDEVELDVDDRFVVDGDESGSRNWSEWSPDAGLTWRPAPGLSVYASVGTSFQTPTTTELANPEDPGSGGGFNRALQPQTARNVELGVRTEPSARLRWEASVFRARIDDAITSFEVLEFSGTGRDFFRNAGRSTRYGVETAVRLLVTETIEVTAAYSHSDFEFDRFETPDGDFGGNRLPGVPRHLVDAGLAWHGAAGGFARLNLRTVGDLYADNANTAESDGYTRVDVGIGRDWRVHAWSVRAFVGIDNLFDTRYNDNVRVNAFGGRFFEPGPGRAVRAGIDVRWGGSDRRRS
ncbi:MAG: TonB-dependent receptor [Wenzhouxiangellaceae bacterium]|nr:TonB-dependent receptor [Wenzhouxiangellaceae bacterium]